MWWAFSYVLFSSSRSFLLQDWQPFTCSLPISFLPRVCFIRLPDASNSKKNSSFCFLLLFAASQMARTLLPSWPCFDVRLLKTWIYIQKFTKLWDCDVSDGTYRGFCSAQQFLQGDADTEHFGIFFSLPECLCISASVWFQFLHERETQRNAWPSDIHTIYLWADAWEK